MNAALHPTRVASLRRRLLRWWDAARRDLPWRFEPGRVDPYRVWISEAMLQQTRVATVIPYYQRFLATFPNLQVLAGAQEERVLAAWSGLGYYTRARSLLRAARSAFSSHGALPGTVEELRKLPGFGPYTAGAVASIAFGIPTPAVDGNAARVLARLFLVSGHPGDSRFTKRVWEIARRLVEGTRGASGRPGDLNQAIIELGALVCFPRTPRCGSCPVARSCAARAAGQERSVPGLLRKGALRRMVFAVGVCRSRGRVLLVRRPPTGLFAGMWSLPMTELRPDADGAAAISTAIRRELSAVTGEFAFAGTVERTLTHRLLELRVFAATLNLLPPRGDGWRLARPAEMESLAIPEAVRRVLARADQPAPQGPAAGGRTISWRGVGTRGERE